MNGEQQSHTDMWMLRRIQLKFILHLYYQRAETVCVQSWMPTVSIFLKSFRDQLKTSTKTKVLATAIQSQRITEFPVTEL